MFINRIKQVLVTFLIVGTAERVYSLERDKVHMRNVVLLNW